MDPIPRTPCQAFETVGLYLTA